MHQISIEEEYWKVKKHVGFIVIDFNVILMQGNDRRDFLHRLSTNEVRNLSPSQILGTILANEKARIIDFILVLPNEDGELLLASPRVDPTVKEWLEKFIIMDDVRLTDLSDNFKVVSFMGTQAISFAQEEFLLQHDLHDGVLCKTKYEGIDIRLFVDPLWRGSRVDCLLQTQFMDEFLKHLGESVPGISHQTMERFRIEQGIPAQGKELSEQVNPLEAGMHDFINFSKGCYIGQEVIARIDTYKKLQRNLQGFIIGPQDTNSGQLGKLYLDGEEVGWTTSHIWSLVLNSEIALGYLRTDVKSPEIDFISLGEKTKSRAVISQLPFSIS